MMTIKETVKEIVNKSQGLKAVELSMRVLTETKYDVKSEDIIKTIEDLVREGEIVELEYILPQMDYRIKSIYFPKGTNILER